MPLTVSVMRNGCFWSFRVDGALMVSGPGSPAGVWVKTNPPSRMTHRRQATTLAQVMAGSSRDEREVALRNAILSRRWRRCDEKHPHARRRQAAGFHPWPVTPPPVGGGRAVQQYA